jgi:hypothetical protein
MKLSDVAILDLVAEKVKNGGRASFYPSKYKTLFLQENKSWTLKCSKFIPKTRAQLVSELSLSTNCAPNQHIPVAMISVFIFWESIFLQTPHN